MSHYKLENKTILIISPESWGKSFVSKHHYATELSKKNKVYFLNPPASIKFKATREGNVDVVDYKAMFKGLSKMPNFMSAILTNYEFKSIEKKLNVKFDIIWNFENSRFFNLSRVRNSIIKISHIVDLNQNFNVALANKTADVTFGVAKSIIERNKQHNTNTFKINHGYKAIEKKLDLKIDFQKKGNYAINVCYVGNLLITYLDCSTVIELIEKNKNIAFHFVGPYKKKKLSNKIDKKENNFINLLSKQKNVFLYGEIESYKIPYVLEQMDILLLCYLVSKYPKQLENSHKMMEYFGSGKVILASYTYEFKDKRNLLVMVEDNINMDKELKKIVLNISQYNNELKKNERIQFAFDNTYEKQIKKIENILEEVL